MLQQHHFLTESVTAVWYKGLEIQKKETIITKSDNLGLPEIRN
jgi:hypothetical protein